MGECFITRRGGGSIKAFAAISVTYPVGSVCTCTSGMKTLKAKDTSGSWIFLVPSSGTWTITITDGDESTSREVLITAYGQTENVKIAYWDGELYLNGNEYEDVTGGWVYSAQGSYGYLEKLETSMYIHGEGNNGIRATTANKIDLSEFSSIKVNITRITGSPSTRLIITDSKVYSESTGIAYAEITAVGEYSLTIPSGAKGEYYIGLTRWGAGIFETEFNSVKLVR